MNPTPSRRRPALACLAALAFAGAAHSAELTLYAEPNFSGPQVTLRGWTPCVSRVGFNDRASSLVLVFLSWEL